MIFSCFQWHSMVFVAYMIATHVQVWWCRLSRSAQNYYFIILLLLLFILYLIQGYKPMGMPDLCREVWWCRLSHKVFILFIYYYYYYFIIPPRPWCLCLVQTGLFACKPCLKYSRIHGTKVQIHIECVKAQQFSMVFNGFQWFLTVFNSLSSIHEVDTQVCGL